MCQRVEHRGPEVVRPIAAVVAAVVFAWTGRAEAAQRPLTTLRYESNGKLVSVPVRVGGSKVLRFVLDSGARHTVIDLGVARTLKLGVRSTSRGSGAGHGTFAQQIGSPIAVLVGRLHVRIEAPRFIDLRHVGTKEVPAGLLGADLFERYVIEIDPVAHTIAFYEPRGFAYAGRGTPVSLSETRGAFYAPMLLTIGRHSVMRRMLVDSGSEDAAADDFVRRSSDRRRSLQGIGLGKPYYDYSGVFDRVRIGPYTIVHSWGASDDRPTFGMEIMRRFRLTFDAPHGRLDLEPNKYFAEAVPAPV